jgi:hypothetical protein
MEDKRELEDLIEKLNDNINFHKQTHANILMTQQSRYDNSHGSEQVLALMLGEKENYINKLE